MSLNGQALLTASDTAPWCSVSDVLGASASVSSALALCELPSVFPGVVPLLAGGSWQTDIVLGGGAAFLALQEPRVWNFSPVVGSLAGGTVVSLMGDGLVGLGSPVCKFGTVSVTATEAEAGLACISPALLPNFVTLALGVNAQQSVDAASGSSALFASVQLPTVLSVLPSEGTPYGEAQPDALTIVTDAISSDGPVPQLACVFGTAASSQASPRTSTGPSFWTCALPPGQLGFTSVQLQLGVASTGVGPGVAVFAYTAPPMPLSLSPRRIGSVGGTLLHVVGHTLHGAASCVVVASDGAGTEGWLSPALVVSSALVLCESPPLQHFADGATAALSLKQSDATAGSMPEGSLPLSVASPVAISDITPSHVSPDGIGTALMLTGTAFRESGHDGAACWLGTVGPVVALDVTSSSLVCVPVAHAPGPLQVGASPLGEPAPWSRFPVQVTVMATTITNGVADSLFPEVVCSSGGCTVQLATGLTVFPDVDLFLVLGTASQVLLDQAGASGVGHITLPAIGPGHSPVSLSDGVSVLASLGQLTVLRPPHVYSIQPVIGVDSGGTHVFFIGAHFWSPTASWAAFFDQTAMVGGACASSVVCVAEAPPASDTLAWAGGDENSRVAATEVTNTPSGVRTSDGVEFTYGALPHVAAATPSAGDAAGGGRVKIMGGPLRDSTFLTCRFGTRTVRPVAVESAAEMFCISPAMAPSSMSVVVSNNNFDFSPVSDGALFTSSAGIMLSFIVTQSGGNLALYTDASVLQPAPQLQCVFGGQGSSTVMVNAAAAKSPASPAAWCMAPTQGVGFTAVDLTLTSAQSGSSWAATLPDPPLFQFLPDPEALVSMPNAATRIGGTVIMIAGRDFGVGVGILGATLVRFGDAGQSAPARVLSSVLVSVEVPPVIEPDTAPLAAARVDGVFVPGAHVAPFAYVADTSLHSANPPGGSVRGGTVVMLAGQGFSSGDAQFCRFGTLGPVRADFVSDVLVRCISPAHVSGPPVQLAVSRANTMDMSAGEGVTFEY